MFVFLLLLLVCFFSDVTLTYNNVYNNYIFSFRPIYICDQHPIGYLLTFLLNKELHVKKYTPFQKSYFSAVEHIAVSINDLRPHPEYSGHLHRILFRKLDQTQNRRIIQVGKYLQDHQIQLLSPTSEEPVGAAEQKCLKGVWEKILLWN